MSIESICLLCRIGNDKTVYSKFQIVSLVDFDINISVELWHVTNIGNRSSTAAQFLVSSPKPPYDLNFKKGYFKTNCLLKHSCMKCEGMHPSAMCNTFKQTDMTVLPYIIYIQTLTWIIQ
jgi:hypothetical protein